MSVKATMRMCTAVVVLIKYIYFIFAYLYLICSSLDHIPQYPSVFLLNPNKQNTYEKGSAYLCKSQIVTWVTTYNSTGNWMKWINFYGQVVRLMSYPRPRCLVNSTLQLMNLRLLEFQTDPNKGPQMLLKRFEAKGLFQISVWDVLISPAARRSSTGRANRTYVYRPAGNAQNIQTTTRLLFVIGPSWLTVTVCKASKW